MKKLLVLVFACLFYFESNAQFGNILGRVTDKVSDRIADKVADAIANEIIKKTFKPVDEAADEALRKSFEDSLGTSEVDYNKMGRAYGEFLAGMNGAYAKIPESYTFDVQNDIEISDGKKINKTRMMFTKSGEAIGYESIDGKESNIVVYDVKNEVMVMYTTDKKGKKKGQVLPSMMKFASSFASNKIDEEMEELKVKKSGGTKKFAGYNAEGYLVETKSTENQVYISSDFPISYFQAYGKFVEQFAPAASNDMNKDLPKGMVMYSEAKDKESKDMSIYEVKKVNLSPFTIKKSDYTFEGQESK